MYLLVEAVINPCQITGEETWTIFLPGKNNKDFVAIFKKKSTTDWMAVGKQVQG